MEKIVVCISNPHHAEKLIHRGKLLADAFKGECIVLNVLSVPYDQLDFNQLQTKLMFKSLSEKYNVQIITEPLAFKKVSHHIADFTERKKATQLVIGQVVQSKLELVLHDSFINSLLEKLKNVDIHIIGVTRNMYTSQEYDKGISATLIPNNDRYEILLSGDNKESSISGTFYQLRSSDFTNGFFVVKRDYDHQVVKVVNGFVDKEHLFSSQ